MVILHGLPDFLVGLHGLPGFLVSLHGLHQQTVAVCPVAQPAQCHREAALGLGVAPGVGACDDVGHLGLGQIPVPAHADGQACALGAGHGLAYRFHIRPGQPELIRIQDRFVAELQCREACLAE